MKHRPNRIVVSVDLEKKNSHRFEDGTTIRLERQFNNLNRRETEPVNCIVVSGDGVPEGSEILVSHNAFHESNRIYNYKNLSGKEEASDIKYYSLPETDCYAWRDEMGQLKPMKGFAFGLRVYEPYNGIIEGIPPKKIPNVLYITTGELEGQVCHVLKASDYEIIFQGQEGREDRVIRCRHFEEDTNEREEIVAISHVLTDKVNDGELLIGLSPETAKTLEAPIY